jgi:hypothetical protein
MKWKMRGDGKREGQKYMGGEGRGREGGNG